MILPPTTPPERFFAFAPVALVLAVLAMLLGNSTPPEDPNR